MDMADRLVQASLAKGAQMAEVYINDNKELSIEVREGKVETMKLAGERGLGLRMLLGGKVGFSYTSDFSASALEDVVLQAVANAASLDLDRYRDLPAPAESYAALDVYDSSIRSATVEEKIAMAITMEQSARKYHNKISIIESSVYMDSESEVTLVNSKGIRLNHRGANCALYLALVAGEGEESQTGFALDYKLKFADLNAPEVGRKAAQRAVDMLGARPVATQSVPVIFDPYVATGFLGLLAASLSGEAVQKGKSLFAGKLENMVASEQITIIDDGTLSGGIASFPFDGEGVPASRTELISGGRLKGFMHNIYTASKEGVTSTGNGVRGSFRSTPEVGVTNFYIQRGTTPLIDMFKGVNKAFLVTEVMGMHTANPISGDFSLGASGIWVEGGELKNPVRGVALAGNIVDILKRITMVGDDLTFYGGMGSPTLLVEEMTVSGH